MVQPPGLSPFVDDLQLPFSTAGAVSGVASEAAGFFAPGSPKHDFPLAYAPEDGFLNGALYDAYATESQMSAPTAPTVNIHHVLARVATRPNARVRIPLFEDPDSCAIIVADGRAFDQPIMYASPGFERLTGYTASNVVGINCRFLQSPDAIPVHPGSPRKFTDADAVRDLKTHISSGTEIQTSLVNYRKGGEPFVNLLTVVPVSTHSPPAPRQTPLTSSV
jgi:PAS domain-containing protein